MNLKQVIQSNDYLVLDTETTGLDHRAEICQIAIIDQDGDVLLDTLVQPMNPIPTAASRIHGIYDKDVQTAPTWHRIAEKVMKIISCRNVVIYNANYDTQIMRQASQIMRIDPAWVNESTSYFCAMNAFARIYGEWNNYHQNYKWQPLSRAAAYYNVPVINAHSALGDCQMTLDVCKAMFSQENE